jgi:hypothetical protein
MDLVVDLIYLKLENENENYHNENFIDLYHFQFLIDIFEKVVQFYLLTFSLED